MGTDSDDINLRGSQRAPMDRRSGLERRSGIERRLQNIDPPGGKDKRRGIDRRSGLDLRSGVDRRLIMKDQSINSGQNIDEDGPIIAAGGLFSWVIALFKRWFS